MTLPLDPPFAVPRLARYRVPMRRPCYVPVLLLAFLVSACPADPQPTDAGPDATTDRGSDARDAGRDLTLDPVDVPTPMDGPPAGFGRRCDGMHPCPSGLACAEGTCHLDCARTGPFCGSPERCCAMGEVCAAGACVAPGAPCTPAPGCGGGDVGRCPPDAYCDATLRRCLSRAASTSTCTIPAASEFRPVESWSWHGSSAHPEYRGVLVTPIVADLNRDGASDVMVVAYRDPPSSYGGTITGVSILCALSGPGDCMGGPRELFCTDPAIELDAWGNLAVADLDATDGVDDLTIVAGLRRGSVGGNGIVAFDAHGTMRWTGRTALGTPSEATVYGGGIAIADLDGDGHAEILVGSTVFNDQGVELWSAGVTCWSPLGPHTLAVDLDSPADGRLEVLCGNSAFRADGTRLWTSTVTGPGWDAVADFDGDGAPEVVVVSSGSVAVLTRTGTAYAPATSFASLGFSGNGGPPTVADLDHDGHPEIGIAGATQYAAFRVADRAAGTHALERIWSQPADDTSSSSTGSAMFDFDGDGVFEVIYQDTCRARVFAGNDGHALMDIPNISGTATNYPTVADLDGDGRAEFILVTDSYYARSSLIPCPSSTPRTDGVRVFRDANDHWQATRGLWNQHGYHVTNVCDGADGACDPAENRHGAVPRHERPSWTGSLNSYRVNARYGLVDRHAPDLVVLSLAADVAGCPATYRLQADVANRGALAVGADTPVSFYAEGADGGRALLGTRTLGRVLAPGGVARVELTVTRAPGAPVSVTVVAVVNDDGTGRAAYRECDPANNRSVPVTVDCSVPG
ncbi:MAG: VCBS repeat-containing protein [Deltaproteobacteria bacterium]|nr:VCBS repeat-containing protein [Deltaproteobacteria bacterium]